MQEEINEVVKPPDEVTHVVTPWQRAMSRVLSGIALSILTLNFLGLNYILPTIGMILCLLGFRALRRENGYFRKCWIITIILTIYFAADMILNATIYQSEFNGSIASAILLASNILFVFLRFVFLWRGFLDVKQSVGLPAHAKPAAAILVWYPVMCILGAVRYSGLIVLLALVVSYVLILRSLVKLSKEMNDTGYTVKTEPAQLSDRTVAISFLAVLAVGIACGYLFFNSYKMDWQPTEVPYNTEIAEIRTHLISLGFPEQVLDDLTEEDILACKGALRVVVETRDHHVNDGQRVSELRGETIYYYTVYDVEELHTTDIAVELPGKYETWKLFHHFLWTVNPGFYGTEALQIIPAYQYGFVGWWGKYGDFTGQILYDKSGETYASPYHTLRAEAYPGSGDLIDVFATFSMPNGGENQRGYVSYAIDEYRDGAIIDAKYNYTHQRSWLQYPVMTAAAKRKLFSSNSAGAFITVNAGFAFYPNSELLK